MRPNLRQIEAFLAVAEAGNFSRAAAQIGMTQPGISQTIRELEGLLNLRLFDRTTRRVMLTAAGEAFRLGAGKSMEVLDIAVAEAKDQSTLRKGFLRLAAPPFLAATVLPRALAEFQNQHPDLTLEMTDTTTAQIMERVANGQADLGLGTFPPGKQGLGSRVVLRDEMMCFAKAGSAMPEPLGLAALNSDKLIVMSASSALRLPVALGFESAGLHLAPAFEVEQIATALALVEAGLGLAILPGYARAWQGRGVVAHPIAGPPMRREVQLIFAADRSLSPAATAFATHLTQSLRKLAP